MAHFIRGTGSDLTPMQHSDNIFTEHLKLNPYNSLMGKKDSDQPIVVDSEKFKGRMAGDTVRYHFIPQNKSEGIYGQNPAVLGNEDSLDEFYMDMKIDQVAKAFAKKGKMTDIRSIWDFREQAKKQITNWYRDKHARWITDALTGYMADGQTYVSDPATAQVVKGEGRLVVSSGASTADIVADTESDETSLLNDYDGDGSALSNACVMNSYILDILQEVAKEGNSDYRMRPIKSENGEEYFMLLLSLQACRQLWQDTNFRARMVALANAGIDPTKDVFAKGALGVWNNIIIKKNEYIYKFEDPDTSGLKYARNLLLGSNALCMGFAQTIDYTEELTDHKRRLSCAADEICGHKKVTFDDVDLNVIQVVTVSI